MKLFTNPFEVYTERKLILVGFVFFILTAFVYSYCELLLFGSLKVLNNYKQNIFESIVNLGMTLLSNVIILYVFARIKYSKTRFIDVWNVVFIAHFAIYVLLYIMALPVTKNALTAVELEILEKGFQPLSIAHLDLLVLLVFGVMSLALIVYFFYLLVVGMKIAMNSKSKTDIVFIIGLVLIWNTILQFLNPYI